VLGELGRWPPPGAPKRLQPVALDAPPGLAAEPIRPLAPAAACGA